MGQKFCVRMPRQRRSPAARKISRILLLWSVEPRGTGPPGAIKIAGGNVAASSKPPTKALRAVRGPTFWRVPLSAAEACLLIPAHPKWSSAGRRKGIGCDTILPALEVAGCGASRRDSVASCDTARGDAKIQNVVAVWLANKDTATSSLESNHKKILYLEAPFCPTLCALRVPTQ